MKIAFVTDNHFDQHNRFAETIRVHDWIAEDAARRGCECTLLGGDLFERKSYPAERNAAADWVMRMAEIGPVIGVYGNHDFQGTDGGDLDILTRLETRFPVEMHAVPCISTPGGTPLAIACLPWPRRAQLVAALGDVSIDGINQAGHQGLRNILLHLGTQLREHDGPKLFLGHVQMRGSMTSTGQELVGCDFELGLEDLSLLDADFYALGHIHLGPGNEWKVGAGTALFGGSPRRCNFGEVETKSYTVIEVDRNGVVGWERIETPTTPQVLVYAEWGEILSNAGEDVETGFGFQDLQHADPGEWAHGSEVRFRYAVEYDQREVAKNAANRYVSQLRSAGAVTIKVEDRVVQRTRARAPEVGRARSLEEKLEAHWISRGFEPGERRESLLSKLRQLEEEDRNAA